MSKKIRQNNVDRFSGFGDLYDQSRPKAPIDLINILTMYLGRSPEVVADVGCGTGLSSFVWIEHAKRIVGIEPNDDMRAVADSRWQESGRPAHLQFVKGLSYALPLEPSSVDLVTCSQSFHWMDPQRFWSLPGYYAPGASLPHTTATGRRPLRQSSTKRMRNLYKSPRNEQAN